MWITYNPYLSNHLSIHIHAQTHQDCELATQQLRAQGLLVGVDVEDALFDSRVLRLEQTGQRQRTGEARGEAMRRF